MEEWASHVMGMNGYVVIALFMLLINLFPPLPAESLIPMTGALIGDQQLIVSMAIMAATLGLVAGTLPLYWLGRLMDESRLRRLLSRHGHWLALSPEDIDRSGRWFRRHGPLTLMFGRVIPGMRSLVSIPAGIHGLPIKQFLLYTTIGSAGWATALIVVGDWLFQHVPGLGGQRVLLFLLALVLGLYLIRLVRHYRRG